MSPEFGSSPPTGLQRLYWHVGTLFWIVYLFFDLPMVIRASQSSERITIQLGLLAAVVVGYVYVVLRPPGQLPLPGRGLAVAAMAASIAALVFLRFPGQWASLLVFVSLAVAVVLPASQAARAIALAGVGTVALSWWQGLPASAIVLAGMQTLISGFGMFAFQHVLGLNLQLRRARQDLARMAVTEERLRFARDLHDLLGHSLSVIALKSELAGALLVTAPERAAAEVHDIQQVARRSLDEVRQAVGGYRRVALAGELLGAYAALNAAGVRAIIDDPPGNLSESAEEVLGWAVREGSTNVLRHSRASTCSVRFERTANRIAVEITDDGRGSDGGRGTGLAGLAERVAAGGGRLQAGPRADGGFRLRIELPQEV
jgi:two-component system, NarL family, sensor histidine kinase DesK